MAEVTSRPPNGTPPSGTDWTTQAADTIESVVGTIRDRTVVPATGVARAIVYGLVLATLGAVLMVFIITTVIRLGSSYLPWWFADRRGRSVWATQAFLGGILTLVGLFFIRKANATTSSKD